MINEGTHDYGRQRTAYDRLVMDGLAPHVMGGNPTPEEAEVQRAMARQATVPTLGELVAENAMNMVATETGALVPAVLAARGDDGWEFDSDRDSEKAARLAGLVKDMDIMCEHVVAAHIPGAALKLAEQWQAIRRITQGGQS